MPTISVVVPAHNASRFLGRSLGSVFSQTRVPNEVIVVDDCSDDETVETASRLGAKVICRSVNGGAAAARNSGIAAAKGDWIAFLDADDEWHPEFLQTIENLMTSYSSSGLLFAEVEAIRAGRSRPPTLGSNEGVIGLAGFCEHFIRYNRPPMCASTAVVRRDVFKDAGMFDETLRIGEDMEMWMRILAVTTAAFSPRQLAKYLRHDASAMRNRQVSPPPQRRHLMWETALTLLGRVDPPTARALKQMINVGLLRASLMYAGSYRPPTRVISDFYPALNPIRFLAVVAIFATPPQALRSIRSAAV